MKKILITSYLPLHKEPSILRQIQALKNNYDITTIGYTPINDNTITNYIVNMPTRKSLIHKIYKLSLLIFWRSKYIKKSLEVTLDLKNILSQSISSPDIIIAHDWEGLYLASELKKKHKWHTKTYFHAHEYGPKQYNASLKWRLTTQPIIINALKKCRDDIDIMSTVCDGIAREYEHFFKFPKDFVRVIINASEYQETLNPNEIFKNKIRLIHHGAAIRHRKLELMIKMMHYLEPDKFELTFMLVQNDSDYYNYLLKISKKFKNIKFIEPVSFSEIPKKINNYDIGLYLLLPKNFNSKYALPNKLFEFIQGRLAIAIGPSIEMMKIVDSYNLGIYSKDFSPKSLARAIARLTPEKIMEYKKNADKYARDLSSEENIQKIRNIITELAKDKC